jgi:histidinol-phosphate aminotransferase
MNLIRRDIEAIDAYQPGLPIEEVKRELGLKSVIKLASNENPFGPSPKAVRAVRRALGSIHRYPEGSCFYLREALARKLNVREDELIFGNGSDELIDIILKALKEPDAEIITSDVTFVEYKIAGSINGFVVKTVPLRDFTFDLNAIARAVTSKTKAIFIANPNNPTGTYVNQKSVLAFLKVVPDDVLVVFDEAYFEFATAPDFPKLKTLIRSKNIALLRTFSKIYGLAGLRIGYMIARPELIAACQRVRQPFNVNTLAQVAARAALDDDAFVKKTRHTTLRERRKLYAAFRKAGIWFKESETNFIFARITDDATAAMKRLLKKGVIIRDMGMYRLKEYARVTVGTGPENRRFLTALTHILKESSL